MIGRDSIAYTAADSALPGMYQLRENYYILPANQPLGFHGAYAGSISLAFYFTRRMVEERNPAIYSGKPVIIIPTAVGGTGFTDHAWNVGDTLYRNTINRTRYIMEKYPGSVVKAILWHQGETDNQAKDSAVYLYRYRLNDLITGFRKELQCPAAPFIAGHVFNQNKNTSPQMYLNIQSLETDNIFCAVISRDSLHDIGDKVHFDAASLKEMGRRYYDAFFTAQQQIHNLILNYKGDIADGVVKDASPNKLHANASSVENRNQDGLGDVMTLNNDALPLPAVSFINALEEGTISFLFRTNRSGRMSFFSAQNVSADDYVELFMDNGKVGFESFFKGVAYTIKSETVYNNDQWHKLILRHTAEGTALYIDDRLVSATDSTKFPFFHYGFNYHFTNATIGARVINNGYKQYFNGTLADFRLYRDYGHQEDTPSVAITKTSRTICQGKPVTFIASGAKLGWDVQYQWYRNGRMIPGATGSMYTADYISTEMPELIQVLACNITTHANTAIAVDTVQVQALKTDILQPSETPPGIPQEAPCEAGNALAYPNPSSGIFNIHTSSEVLVLVKDVQGKTVFKKKVIQKLDLSEQPSGMYIIMLYNLHGELIGTQKIVKR